jgi:hypothetical protein
MVMEIVDLSNHQAGLNKRARYAIGAQLCSMYQEILVSELPKELSHLLKCLEQQNESRQRFGMSR